MLIHSACIGRDWNIVDRDSSQLPCVYIFVHTVCTAFAVCADMLAPRIPDELSRLPTNILLFSHCHCSLGTSDVHYEVFYLCVLYFSFFYRFSFFIFLFRNTIYLKFLFEVRCYYFVAKYHCDVEQLLYIMFHKCSTLMCEMSHFAR